MMQILEFLEKHPMAGVWSVAVGWIISKTAELTGIWIFFQKLSLLLGVIIAIMVVILKIDYIYEKFFKK